MRQKKSKFLSVFLALAICAGSSLYQPQVARAQATFVHPEDIRGALRNLAATLGKLAPAGSDAANRMAQVQQQIDQFTFEEVNALAQAYDGPRLLAAVEVLKSAVAAQEEAFRAAQGAIVPQAALIPTLDSPNYDPACGSVRTPSALVLFGLLLAREVLEDAAVVAVLACDALQNVEPISCGISAAAQVLVIGAQVVLDLFEVCSDSIDSAEIEAAWKNTKVIHSDLATHDSHLTTHDNNLAAHDADIKARLNQIDAVLQEIIRLLITPQGRRPGFPRK